MERAQKTPKLGGDALRAEVRIKRRTTDLSVTGARRICGNVVKDGNRCGDVRCKFRQQGRFNHHGLDRIRTAGHAKDPLPVDFGNAAIPTGVDDREASFVEVGHNEVR
jgi:hypothetical protein